MSKKTPEDKWVDWLKGDLLKRFLGLTEWKNGYRIVGLERRHCIPAIIERRGRQEFRFHEEAIRTVRRIQAHAGQFCSACFYWKPDRLNKKVGFCQHPTTALRLDTYQRRFGATRGCELSGCWLSVI